MVYVCIPEVQNFLNSCSVESGNRWGNVTGREWQGHHQHPVIFSTPYILYFFIYVSQYIMFILPTCTKQPWRTSINRLTRETATVSLHSSTMRSLFIFSYISRDNIIIKYVICNFLSHFALCSSPVAKWLAEFMKMMLPRYTIGLRQKFIASTTTRTSKWRKQREKFDDEVANIRKWGEDWAHVGELLSTALPIRYPYNPMLRQHEISWTWKLFEIYFTISNINFQNIDSLVQ